MLPSIEFDADMHRWKHEKMLKIQVSKFGTRLMNLFAGEETLIRIGK